jgi:hypothetical protein
MLIRISDAYPISDADSDVNPVDPLYLIYIPNKLSGFDPLFLLISHLLVTTVYLNQIQYWSEYKKTILAYLMLNVFAQCRQVRHEESELWLG